MSTKSREQNVIDVLSRYTTYLRHLVLRDWLRAHPDDRDRYAARKYEAAAEHPMSMAHYVGGKAAVIVEILKRAGLR